MGAKTGADITVEGDEGYTRLGENLPPSRKNGSCIEHKSCYWIEARAGLKILNYCQSNRNTMAMGKMSQYI